MDKIKIYIKDKYGLSNYQMAQLTFVIKSTSSELSKILLMGIAFQNHLKLYIFLLIIMCFLRTFSGGLHFYTYKKCLLASTTYMGVTLSFSAKRRVKFLKMYLCSSYEKVRLSTSIGFTPCFNSIVESF